MFHKSFWSVLRSQALETPVEPDLALHQSLPDLLRNLLRNPVEPDLALHQSLSHLHRNLLQNPVEPDLALHQSLPDLLRNLLRNPVEHDLALHQSLPDLTNAHRSYSGLKTPLAYAVGELYGGCSIATFDYRRVVEDLHGFTYYYCISYSMFKFKKVMLP